MLFQVSEAVPAPTDVRSPAHFGLTLGSFPEADVSSFAIHDPAPSSEAAVRKAFLHQRYLELLAGSRTSPPDSQNSPLGSGTSPPGSQNSPLGSGSSPPGSQNSMGPSRAEELDRMGRRLRAEWAGMSRAERREFDERRPWAEQLAATEAATATGAKVFLVISTSRGALTLSRHAMDRDRADYS